MRGEPRKLIRSSEGMTLVEILVVTAIMGIVSLLMSTMFMNSARQSRTIEVTAQFTSLVNMIQSSLNNTNECRRLFGIALPGQPVAPLLIPALGSAQYNAPGFLVPGGLRLAPGLVIQENGVFGDLRITNVRFLNRQELDANQGLYSLNLRLEVDRSGGQAGVTRVGGNAREMIFPLVIGTNLGNREQMIFCNGQTDNRWTAVINGARTHISYNAGNVGINAANPAFNLDVLGTIRAMTYIYASDRRLKKEIRELDLPLERLLSLRGVSYEWKKPASETMKGRQLGLIAQEVEEVFPEAVVTDPKTGMKSVAYSNLVSPLIEAIKEQQRAIDRQAREIQEIRQQCASRSGPKVHE